MVYKFLKDQISKNALAYSILQICKYRKDKDYLDLVSGLRHNPEIVVLHSCGEKTLQPVCLIEAGGKNDGFFACIRWALDGLYFCDQYGFTPVIMFSEGSIYKDQAFFDKENAFEYYFEQPSAISLQMAQRSSHVQYMARNRLLAERLNDGIGYVTSDRYINCMAELMDKYLRFNSRTQKVIQNYIADNTISSDILGIHIRGTDYKSNFKNHPMYIMPEEYDPYIQEAFATGKFSKLFLATDDSEIVEQFIKKYGAEKVLYDKGIQRSAGTVGIHVSSHQPYQAGLDVICDMAALSACGGLISGLSQVSLVARIYKLSRGESFVYDKRINKGINAKGLEFSR